MQHLKNEVQDQLVSLQLGHEVTCRKSKNTYRRWRNTKFSTVDTRIISHDMVKDDRWLGMYLRKKGFVECLDLGAPHLDEGKQMTTHICTQISCGLKELRHLEVRPHRRLWIAQSR